MALLQARFNPIIKYSLFISLDMTLNNFVTKKGSTNHRCRIYHTQIQLEYYEYDIDISWNRLHDAKTMMYFLREKEWIYNRKFDSVDYVEMEALSV